MAIDYKAKDIRNIAYFRNCTGKWYTTVKKYHQQLMFFTFRISSHLLSREMVLAIVELCGPNARLCILKIAGPTVRQGNPLIAGPTARQGIL